MKAIYSCKLYKASPRKDKIRCAIENPVNAELVAQLAEYLDEEYQTPAYLDRDMPSSIDDNATSDAQDDFSSGSGFESSFGTSGGGGSYVPNDIELDDSFDTEEDIEAEGSDLDVDIDSTLGDSTDLGTEGSESSEGTEDDVPIEQSTDITDGDYSQTCKVTVDSVNSLKDVLNSDNDTAGVDRANIKENEVWFYYNDYTNLNNVMTPVIDLISNSAYDLEFNRLARSANAIVFQICSTESYEDIDDLEVESDATKSA